MQFSVNVSDFIGPLQELVSIAGENAADKRDDISNNILLSVKGRELFLKTTNYSMTLSTTVPLLVVDEEGSTTINAGKLKDVLNTLRGESKVYFNYDKAHEVVTLKSDTTTFEIRTRSADTFPGIEPVEAEDKVTISQKTFKTLLEKSKFCICNDEYREYLKGLRLEVEEDQIAIFTSDSVRLAMVEANISNRVPHFTGIILTKKCVDKLYSILDINSDALIDIMITRDTISTVCNGYTLVSKLITCSYPNVRGIIPRNIAATAYMPRENLITQLKKVSSITVNGTKSVTFTLNHDRLELRNKNAEQEIATTSIMVTYKAKPFEVTYNADLLREILEKINSKNVAFSFSDPLTNTLIFPAEDQDDAEVKAKYVISKIVL